jgi:molybdopterin/thiamine biosynthesis adenylyltransferase
VSSSGRLIVKTALPFRGEDIEVRVVFPFDYPDVGPLVLGPQDLLLRHQNRRLGNFCLLEDPRADWWPSMAAAHLVDEDLRWLLQDSEEGAEAIAAGEADMPEPLSQHIAADAAWVVLAPDPFWSVELGTAQGEFVLQEKFLGKGYVLVSADGFGAANSQLVDDFLRDKGARHVGRWAALPDGALSSWPSEEDVLNAADAAFPQLLGRLKRTLARERKRPDVDGWVAVTFMEEGPTRGEHRRGWIFLRVRLDRRGQREVMKVARALALTATERARRVPELVGLEHARILVVGAGSLGAPLVFELVKAGVGRTEVADFDRYDVNNAVRHVLDPRWAGTNKAVAVSIEAHPLNRFVDVRPHDLNVGSGPKDSAQLDALLDAVDLVVDATGSQAAARVLQRRCREVGKTLVLASLTAGSYGGEVCVFRTDGPCYYCFVLGQQHNSVPKPVEGPRSNTTPVGCSTPAFSGAGFDATALAALAARTAVRASGKCHYPALDYDYVVVNFRGDDPWRQGTLSTHPGCPICG